MKRSREREVTELLRRAAGWRLVGLLFERPRTGWHAEVAALADEVADADLRAAAALVREADEGGYLAALGPGASASPREVAYRPMHDPGRVLADLAGSYAAFGYRPRTEDPADHVAVEAGFVGYLVLKEAYALASGEDGARETTREALEAFATEHLDTLAAELPSRLAGCAVPHLSAAAGVLGKWRPAATRQHLETVAESVPASCSDGPWDCAGACPAETDSFPGDVESCIPPS